MTSDPTAIEEDTATGGSMTVQLFNRLRDDILTGVLEPGSKLKIENLRERYSVGASPVREALSMLTSEGLVQRLDQRGFRVTRVSLEAFEELLRTRCWLEDRALRESISNGPAEWEENVVLAHHRLSRIGRTDAETGRAAPQWEVAHKVFHMALISACRSGFLIRYCEQLYDLNIRYRNIAGAAAYPSRNVVDEHRAICDATVDRDADRAVELLVDHYNRTGSFLSLRLKEMAA